MDTGDIKQPYFDISIITKEKGYVLRERVRKA